MINFYKLNSDHTAGISHNLSYFRAAALQHYSQLSHHYYMYSVLVAGLEYLLSTLSKLGNSTGMWFRG
jgi:hypothetical protein